MTYYVPQTMSAGSPPATATNGPPQPPTPQTPTARMHSTPPHIPHQPSAANGAPPNGYITTFIQSPTNESKNAIITVPPGSNVFQYPAVHMAPPPPSGNVVPPPAMSANAPTYITPAIEPAPLPVTTPISGSNSSGNSHPKASTHRGPSNVNAHSKNTSISTPPVAIKNGPAIFRTPPNIISNGIPPPPINVVTGAGPPVASAPPSSNHPHPHSNNTNNSIPSYERKKPNTMTNRKIPNGPLRPNAYNHYVPHQNQSHGGPNASISTPPPMRYGGYSGDNSANDTDKPNTYKKAMPLTATSAAPSSTSTSHTNTSANANKNSKLTTGAHSTATSSASSSSALGTPGANTIANTTHQVSTKVVLSKYIILIHL